MKKIIFLIAIIVSGYGCKKDDTFISSSSLIGEWSWISTCGGIAGICYTPKSTNQRINLVFTVDSMYKSFINDTLKDSGKFYVYKLISADTKDTSNILQYGSSNEIFSIIRDTLYFNHSDLCFDCFSTNYKRIVYYLHTVLFYPKICKLIVDKKPRLISSGVSLHCPIKIPGIFLSSTYINGIEFI